MEAGPQKVNKTEFKDCLKLCLKRPYILRLAFSAGIGGLLFGYDTGVISGALLYIRDDISQVERSTLLQETIVSMAVAGAIIGAGLGGWMNDRYGRKLSILFADFLFFIGAIVMGVAPNPGILILGRALVGLGVGMASMTAPLYISEVSPHKIRGALVSLNGLLITGGQFLAYLINLAFTRVNGTWRWMLGIAALPALIQFILMLTLPESPRWLYRKERKGEAEAILKKVYPADEATKELGLLRQSVESEVSEEGAIGEACLYDRVKKAWSTRMVRRGLIAGIVSQVAQQFCGINTVMYYAPTIVQLAGYSSNSTALALSLITSGLNAVGSIVSMFFVDRSGRRRLMIISLCGIILWLGVLSGVFYASAVKSPSVGVAETQHFTNFTCPAYIPATMSKWKCVDCLNAQCAFCANSQSKLSAGACMNNPEANDPIRHACQGEGRDWYTQGCPTNFGWIALISLAAYIISYSPGMGTAPWIVNSEIYPLRYRGICGGMAAIANWISNLIVSLTFLSLTKAIGTASTFLLFGGYSVIALVLIYLLVPETKGLPFEEVEKMLSAEDYMPWKGTGAEKKKEMQSP